MTSSVRALRLALVLSVLLPSTALADAWVLPPGDWSTEIRGTFFNADTYRNGDGTRVPLENGGVFEQHSLSAWNEFGWKKNLGVFVSIPYVSATRRFANDQRLLSTTVLGDMRLGARYALLHGATALSVNVTWKAPMGYNRSVSQAWDVRDTVVTETQTLTYPFVRRDTTVNIVDSAPGRGQQDIAGTIAFGVEIAGRGFIEAEAGYNYRFDDPADQFVAAASAGLWFGNLLIGGRYQGAQAIGDGTTPIDKISEHLVGPVVLYRIDDHIDLSAGSLHTAAGEHVLHADRVYVALTVKQSALNRLQGFLGNAHRP